MQREGTKESKAAAEAADAARKATAAEEENVEGRKGKEESRLMTDVKDEIKSSGRNPVSASAVAFNTAGARSACLSSFEWIVKVKGSSALPSES